MQTLNKIKIYKKKKGDNETMSKLRYKIAVVVKRRPVLYRYLKKIYSYYFRVKEHIFGTKVREKEWATRHLTEGDDWIKHYWDTRNTKRRAYLIDRISNFYPFSDVLEIGCCCAPNLYLLAKKFPNIQIKGTDINQLAIQKGNEFLAQENISNVKLSVGKADELMIFQDKSFDIVFTNGVLVCIGKDKIEIVIKEMIRITRKALILAEDYWWNQDEDEDGLGILYRDGFWKRNYLALLSRFVPEEQIRIIKLPENIWDEKDPQKKDRVLIEVILDKNLL